MLDWRKAIVSLDTTIREMIEVISKGSLQAAVVVGENEKLLGIVTDGDLRRAMLQNFEMTDTVKMIMHKNCTKASPNDSEENMIYLMQRSGLSHLPIVDDTGRIVDLKVLVQLLSPPQFDNWVILMAGGMGTRLRPHTENCPKPLLKVGGTPLLETIITNLKKNGLSKFFISVNYKARMIEEYLGDGSELGVEISYINEEKRLGTAGALSLLSERPTQPIFVMNSDLLTNVNFRHLLDFHKKNSSTGTMCVREHQFEIPYGVTDTDGYNLINIREKPLHRYFVNAGIYLLEPEVLDLIPKDTYFDMTTLFEKLIQNRMNPTIFPVHEYWLDIGESGDYNQAHTDFHKNFHT